MKELQLFGCHNFYTGGKIVGFITLIENVVRAGISFIFLMWAFQEQTTQKLEKGEGGINVNQEHFKNESSFQKYFMPRSTDSLDLPEQFSQSSSLLEFQECRLSFLFHGLHSSYSSFVTKFISHSR